jgi:hypothetical protein
VRWKIEKERIARNWNVKGERVKRE